MTCQHCGDKFPAWKCETCKRSVNGQCFDCHMELAHGTIKNANLHIAGPALGGGHSRPEEDPDAFGRADQENE